MPRRPPGRSTRVPPSREAELEALLAARDARVAELERQRAATAEVLAAISRAPADLQAALDKIAASAAGLSRASNVRLYRLDGERFVSLAAYGDLAALAHATFPPFPLERTRIVGRAVLERRTVHVPDMQTERAHYPYLEGARTFLALPLLGEDRPVGAFLLWREEVAPFSDDQIALVETFADQAVIAIENARLFSELQERLAEQTATAEVLRVISESPTDLPAVLGALVGKVAALFAADDVLIHRVHGDHTNIAAAHGTLADAIVKVVEIGRAS